MAIHLPTFSAARMRLTVTYLAIIMALTLGFSVIFYYQSINEAKIGLSRQENQLRENLYFTTPEGIAQIRNEELDTFRDNLLAKLILINSGMLIIGFGVSFYLARRALKPLEEMVIAQGRFTSDAAHELRTPLTAMKTEVEVSLMDKKLSAPDARKVLKSNLEEIAKLEALTSALLRLARSSETVDTSNWQDYRLADILQASFDRLSDKAAKRKIDVKLPKTRLLVHGDPDQLVELFVTLFGNAIKYSHENSEVVVKAERRDNKTKVHVIDHGVGITAVDLPHIFDRFYRADVSRNKTKAEGYGLGLSLAQAIVHAHKGKIKVKSEYGKGSTFTVELPVA